MEETGKWQEMEKMIGEGTREKGGKRKVMV